MNTPVSQVWCSELSAENRALKLFLLYQNIDEIPADLKALYKTVWEISQKTVIKMAADRGAYIDQSQSLNIHIAEPNYGKLTSMHFYAWKMVSSVLCGRAHPSPRRLLPNKSCDQTNGSSCVAHRLRRSLPHSFFRCVPTIPCWLGSETTFSMFSSCVVFVWASLPFISDNLLAWVFCVTPSCFGSNCFSIQSWRANGHKLFALFSQSRLICFA